MHEPHGRLMVHRSCHEHLNVCYPASRLAQALCSIVLFSLSQQRADVTAHPWRQGGPLDAIGYRKGQRKRNGDKTRGPSLEGCLQVVLHP